MVTGKDLKEIGLARRTVHRNLPGVARDKYSKANSWPIVTETVHRCGNLFGWWFFHLTLNSLTPTTSGERYKLCSF